MKNYFKLNVLLIALIALIWSGCASTKTASSASYIGVYASLVKDTPNGDIESTFIIRHDGENYSATIGSDRGTIDVEEFKIDGNVLTGHFSMESYEIDMKGEIIGNEIKGKVGAEGYDFTWTATKN